MAVIERKVKFLRDYEVADERAGTAQADRYAKGKTYKLAEPSALHFVSRGAAELID